MCDNSSWVVSTDSAHNYLSTVVPSLVQDGGGMVTMARRHNVNKNSSGDEIANVNFFYNIAHVEASAYAH